MKYEEFERIYQEYYLKILTFIHKRVPDLYEAEELTGDVFLSFYRNMDSYDEEKGSIATWLYAITANRLKNYYRDKKTHYSLEILKQQTIPREKMPEEIVAKIMREETLEKVWSSFLTENGKFFWEDFIIRKVPQSLAGR